jgi:hypothetical protein
MNRKKRKQNCEKRDCDMKDCGTVNCDFRKITKAEEGLLKRYERDQFEKEKETPKTKHHHEGRPTRGESETPAKTPATRKTQASRKT